MKTAIVVGNLKPKSRTFEAATLIAEKLTGTLPDVEVDLVDLGPGLVGSQDPKVVKALDHVRSCQLAIFASPTFKATYSGLLKLFLDQFPPNGLNGIVGVPLMLGAAPHHALAPELLLKPVIVELGAICPLRGLYLLDSNYNAPEAWESWLATAQNVLKAFR